MKHLGSLITLSKPSEPSRINRSLKRDSRIRVVTLITIVVKFYGER